MPEEGHNYTWFGPKTGWVSFCPECGRRERDDESCPECDDDPGDHDEEECLWRTTA